MSRVRVLPFLMVLAAFALLLRVGAMWSGAEALAKEAPPAEPPAAAAETQAAPGEQVASAGQEEPPAAADAAATGEATPLETSLPADPFQLTDEEIELLQALSERREILDQRAREIEDREALLAAAEARIDEKIAKLQELRTMIEGLLAEHGEQEEAKMKSLVKIYEAMKPKDAARIFEQLDDEVLLGVVERMKERKSAPILAEMNPDRAKELTLQLAQRRVLPVPKE